MLLYTVVVIVIFILHTFLIMCVKEDDTIMRRKYTGNQSTKGWCDIGLLALLCYCLREHGGVLIREYSWQTSYTNIKIKNIVLKNDILSNTLTCC